MSRRSFRFRLFTALFVAGAVPLLVATVLALLLLSHSPMLRRADIDAVQITERTLLAEMKRAGLPGPAQLALNRHNAAVTSLVGFAHNAQLYKGNWPEQTARVMIIPAIVLVIAVALAGQLLARQYSAPLDEVVDWTRRIDRHEPLPRETARDPIPEFLALRDALRELQRGLEQARSTELESERLRAFGEVARRVAHEMKNPLTPIRLAVAQMNRTAPADMREALEVIALESARLEAMAREFAELGRLPEGVSAPVDLRELLDELLKSTVPDSMVRRFECGEGVSAIDGYYDPLRRAFSNLLRNAVEACGDQGSVSVALHRRDGQVEITVSDSGPGISPEKRELIFEPYYTEKGDGTGLGLAIVRQTIEQHHGTVAVRETLGGGATFLVRLPA